MLGLCFSLIILIFKKKSEVEREKKIEEKGSIVDLYNGPKFLLIIIPLLTIFLASVPFIHQLLDLKNEIFFHKYSLYIFVGSLIGIYFCILNYFKEQD